MHEWTRAFFGAHAFKLNTKKTKLMATGQRRKLRGKFLGVDGRLPIAVMDSKADFRYLGVQMSIGLTWDAEISRLQKHVDWVGASIRTHGNGKCINHGWTPFIRMWATPSI